MIAFCGTHILKCARQKQRFDTVSFGIGSRQVQNYQGVFRWLANSLFSAAVAQNEFWLSCKPKVTNLVKPSSISNFHDSSPRQMFLVHANSLFCKDDDMTACNSEEMNLSLHAEGYDILQHNNSNFITWPLSYCCLQISLSGIWNNNKAIILDSTSSFRISDNQHLINFVLVSFNIRFKSSKFR